MTDLQQIDKAGKIIVGPDFAAFRADDLYPVVVGLGGRIHVSQSR